MIHSLDSLRALAHAAHKSGLLPQEVRGADAAFYIMAAGVEMGFQPVESLRALALVKGKVSVSAQGQLALAIKRGVRVHWPKHDATSATICLTRDGSEPFTLSYTMEDAARAGLTGRQTWKNHPAAMLRARAASAAVKAFCPDVLLGVYDPDETAEIARNSDPSPSVSVIEARPAVEPMQIEAGPDALALLDGLGWSAAAVAAYGVSGDALPGFAKWASGAGANETWATLRTRLGKRLTEVCAAGALDAAITTHGPVRTWLNGDPSECHARLTAIKSALAGALDGAPDEVIDDALRTREPGED